MDSLQTDFRLKMIPQSAIYQLAAHVSCSDRDERAKLSPRKDRVLAYVRLCRIFLFLLTLDDFTFDQTKTNNPYGYRLDSRDLGGGSGFDMYRRAIVGQLEQKETQRFFRDNFIDALYTWEDSFELRHDNVYLRILIEIVPKGEQDDEKREGINVSVLLPSLDKNHRRESRGKLKQITWINEWRDWVEENHDSYTGVGIAIDFKVYCGDNKICFGVQLGLPLLKGQVEDLEPPQSCWRDRILKALSDCRKRNPRAILSPAREVPFTREALSTDLNLRPGQNICPRCLCLSLTPQDDPGLLPYNDIYSPRTPTPFYRSESFGHREESRDSQRSHGLGRFSDHRRFGNCQDFFSQGSGRREAYIISPGCR